MNCNNYRIFPKYNDYFKKEVEKYYLPEMINTIGKIDLNVLESRTETSLYYLFPLIERLVIEILKYKEDANIEFYEQGTYRTLNSILDIEENTKYFDKDLINLIQEYYRNDGLRNKMLHFKGDDSIEITTIDLLATKVIVIKLIKLYNITLNQFYNTNLHEISLL